MAILSPITTTRITKAVNLFGSSIKSARKSIGLGISNLDKKVREKRKFLTNDNILFVRRRENVRRQEQTDLVEAGKLGRGVASKGVNFLGNSAKSFLGRIMDFVSSLFVGWLLYNAPVIIFGAKELVRRIGTFISIGKAFIFDIGSSVLKFGNVLGAVLTNIVSFDFTDSSKRVSNAFDNLNNVFTDMQNQIDAGIGLFTTPLNQSASTGKQGPNLGDRYPAQPDQGPSQPSGGGGGGAGGNWSPLLSVIRKAEATPGNEYESISGRRPIRGLTSWTIQNVANNAPSYAGAYQLDPNEVVRWAKDVGLNPEDKFSPANQDKIAIGLIEGRAQGKKWKSNKISDQQFGNNLATIWAGLPLLSGSGRGSSYYSGVSWNKANVSPNEVEKSFKQMNSTSNAAIQQPQPQQQAPQQQSQPQQSKTPQKPSPQVRTGGGLKQYITGDRNDKSHYAADHDSTYIRGRFSDNYHDHLAFTDRKTAIEAFKFFRQKGFLVTEFLGYDNETAEQLSRKHGGPDHPAGLAFDIPGKQWGGTPGTVSGPKEWAGSAKVKQALNEFLSGRGGTSNVSVPQQTSKSAGPSIAPAQQPPSQIAQERTGPTILLMQPPPQEPQQQMPQGGGGGGGIVPMPIMPDKLNSYMIDKILLELAYT